MNTDALGGQDIVRLLELEFQVVVCDMTWCWELNSGPLQEQFALLTL